MKVLIAHQSTIPHYRVPFYNALERRRPASWSFEVVFDPAELERKSFFSEPVDPETFEFSTLQTRTFFLRTGPKKICYQNFLRNAADYDLIIVENAVNNLSYPLSHLFKFVGKKIAYWGHGKYWTIEKLGFQNRLSEMIKIASVRGSDGFFAYTDGVKSYLVDQGVDPKRIFVLNNTIDIRQQRIYYEKEYEKRRMIRQKLGVDQKQVLLFVGRITKRKRIDFLLDAFREVLSHSKDYHLFLVGDGEPVELHDLVPHVSQFGAITELEELAPLYIASDIYTLPGVVGLGPLQALCYDLPVVVIDAPNHNPEIEYLTPQNSIKLDASATPATYAEVIRQLFLDTDRLTQLKRQTWASIEYLTIENMADRFIGGVNQILNL